MSDVVDFRGGDFRGPVIGKAEYKQQAPAPTALDALPPRAAGFTGRDQELGRLRAALDPSGSGGEQAVLVTAVSGLGGIGKTALAVQAAYAAREAGWFPGGVLFVDLHGYDEVPVTADQALQSLLRALGVDPEHIPATADERAGLYRSVLADRATMLILADNASSPEQVRPLLPGGLRHRVLVTSRDRLAQLGARLVPLDQLTPEAAYELLDRALMIADPDDDRVAGEGEAAARLAGLCGHLPLALQIAAALLAEDPGQSIAEFADELATSYDRLAALDDGDRSVRAAFDISYRRLPADHARLLSLLALAPGPEVSEEVAGVLVGGAPPTAGLKALARAHLVERGNGRRCWRMHDLVRAFGAGRLAGDPEARDAARERVLAHYYRWADEADDLLHWRPGKPESARFAHRAEALAWLDRERAGLVAAVQWAREERHADTAVRLALCLTGYLRWRRQLDDAIAVCATAQEAAHGIGDRVCEAMAWHNLGTVLRASGQVNEAVDAHLRSWDLHQDLGDRPREAWVWNNLGNALLDMDRVDEAIDAHTHSLDLHQDIGDRAGEAGAWNNLGTALLVADRVDEAIDAHIRSRDLYQTLGDRHSEASAWNNLGNALARREQTHVVTEAYHHAVVILREFEDWYGLGKTFENLAIAQRSIHHPAEARAYYVQSADAYTRANAPKEAARTRARAATLTGPEKPTDKPAPDVPPARTEDFAPPAPRPPDAPGIDAR